MQQGDKTKTASLLHVCCHLKKWANRVWFSFKTEPEDLDKVEIKQKKCLPLRSGSHIPQFVLCVAR